MRQFQNKKKIRSRVYSGFSVSILIILVLFLAKGVFNIYQKEAESEKVKQSSLKNLNDLKDRQEKLNSEISNLNTTSGMEAEIRSKFSVVKQGEQVIVIVPADVSTSTLEKEQNIFEKMWNKFLSFF